MSPSSRVLRALHNLSYTLSPQRATMNEFVKKIKTLSSPLPDIHSELKINVGTLLKIPTWKITLISRDTDRMAGSGRSALIS